MIITPPDLTGFKSGGAIYSSEADSFSVHKALSSLAMIHS
ncbi:hypothetical protein EFM55_07195 [Lactiplantibacillus pentosus]|nr:hypothetical protein [Lactiplantibacillus pentosus]